MKQPIKAIIFDMDGLLLDSESISLRAWQAICQARSLEIDAIYPKLIGRGVEACDKVLMDHFGAHFPLETVRTEKSVCLEELILKFGIPVKPGAFELFELALARAIPTALATSATRNEATLKLKSAGIVHSFTARICGDEVARTKPFPDLFLAACGLLSLEPANCLVLEDSHAGVEAALAAGCQVIMVPDLIQPEQWIYDRKVTIANSLFEVANLLMD